MSKIQFHKVDREKRLQLIGEFYDIVNNLKTKNDVFGFFIGLLTPSEALMFARRIQIAKMLLDDRSYEEIKKLLGVGASTIMTVAHWLNSENEQFKSHILLHMNRMREDKTIANRFPHEKMLDKYPEAWILKKLFGLK